MQQHIVLAVVVALPSCLRSLIISEYIYERFNVLEKKGMLIYSTHPELTHSVVFIFFRL